MTPACPRALRSGIDWRGCMLLVLACLMAGASAVHAQSAPIPEPQVKAAYLFKFAGFVEWPAEAFATRDAPLVIGVAGADEIASALATLVEGQRVDRRLVQVRRVADGASLDGPLHVLLVGEPGRAERDRVLRQARGRPVLVVASQRLADAPGVMITFVLVQRRVRFEVALAPVAAERLRLSALMLSAAHRVEQQAR